MNTSLKSHTFTLKDFPMRALNLMILMLSLFLYIPNAYATIMNFCDTPSWIVFPGVGYSYFNATSMVGLELSATMPRRCNWFGVYADHYTDFHQKNKSSIGLEFGNAFLGLDLGYMHFQNDEDAYNGIRIRPIISIGFISVYAGGFFTSDLKGFFDGGILLKLPFCNRRGSGLKLLDCF